MGVVLFSLQKRKLTHRVFTPFSEFWVDSRAVGIILIAYTIFSLTLSFLPATRLVFISFWQHPSIIGVSVIAGLLSGKLMITWFCRVIAAPAANVNVCKEIAASRRVEKI